MLEQLGVDGGTILIGFIVLYYVIKWAVKNGINESILNQTVKKSVTDELAQAQSEIKKAKEGLANLK